MDTGTTKTYSPNTLNQYTAAEGTTVSNGSEHEIASYQGNTYSYVNDERLKTVSSGSNNYSLAYDALGRCVKRTLNGVTIYYVYDGEKPVLEYNSSGTIVGRNLYGKAIDEIVLRVDVVNNWTLYYQQDHEGSVTHLTNASGAVIEKYRYDAFGAPTIYNGSGTQLSSSAYNNRFLFTGREYAATFSFYEYRARAYNPTLGRFMSEDPKLFVHRMEYGTAPADWSFSAHPDDAEFNLFRYCGNEPLDFTDPMGLDSGPFQDADSAYRYLHGTLNSLSIKENVEFRTLVYRNASGEIWTNKTAVGSSHKVAPNQIPDNAKLLGDHHTHGGYTYRNPVTGQMIRANGAHPNIRGVADNQASDHPSPPDMRVWRAEAKDNPDFSAGLSGPGGKLLKWDAQHSQAYSIPTAPVPVPKHQDPPPQIPIRIN